MGEAKLHLQLEFPAAWFHGALGMNGTAESPPEEFCNFQLARNWLWAPPTRGWAQHCGCFQLRQLPSAQLFSGTKLEVGALACKGDPGGSPNHLLQENLGKVHFSWALPKCPQVHSACVCIYTHQHHAGVSVPNPHQHPALSDFYILAILVELQ